jgi:hypothetical protein
MTCTACAATSAAVEFAARRAASEGRGAAAATGGVEEEEKDKEERSDGAITSVCDVWLVTAGGCRWDGTEKWYRKCQLKGVVPLGLNCLPPTFQLRGGSCN